ncbi:Histone acetyltransferase KAT8 [Golovinomyces cichoracearum]|uniref:histone acetyltransferase n=1 Tax=Golovinomyces cichoracearum TaxID=62708 RepID=A0A420J1C0_9PEZI|nr:Histone acetyltransferase KAT8 [Golovinomyces cichoracearum]
MPNTTDSNNTSKKTNLKARPRQSSSVTTDCSQPTKSNSFRKTKKIFSNASAKESTPYSRKRKEVIKEDRNIENVVLGDVRFEAWYSSWYPKEFIGKGNKTIKDLYVCPKCFAYSRGENENEIRAWLKHWQGCRRTTIPGKKIYVHGDWKKMNEDTDNKDVGTWSMWEVDGATETLFCQNLSLFAKLFLESKSVFFDVSGFKFFLLVYSSPSAPLTNYINSNTQIVGFFSKEKMSWDNNNLACILIFPPWHRKGLGSLLIGISYAISKRENIIGGPERPISDSGMKGYHGFWGREIARFLLNQDKDINPCVDIETISRETWISPDDCLTMIKEMDVIERADSTRQVSACNKALHQCNRTAKRERDRGEKPEIFIDKQLVRDWVKRKGIRLDRIVSDSGFRPGYAVDSSHNESVKILFHPN